MQPNKVNEVNTTRVLQRIWLSEGTTRVALVEELDLVKSTVSRIVTSLLELGIVKETATPQEKAGVGRKPVLLEINKDYGMILGVEIQPDFYNAVAIDLRGAVLELWSGRLSMAGKTPMDAFLEILDHLSPWIDERPNPLLGIGVAVAGIVDQHAGSIRQSNPLNIFQTVDFLRTIEDRVSVPVILENDANCCCWGELASRKTSRHSSFLFVLGEFRTGETENDLYWGIAIGLGLVLNGEVYHGSSYSAGEFQSILWQPGNEGQLSITNDQARRIKKDDAVMKAALTELCSHIALFVNTLNLEAVVFGGEITQYRDVLTPMLSEEIQRNWSYSNQVECSIEYSTFNTEAVAYGAAGMFLESIFTIPEMFTKSGSTKRSLVSVIQAQ